MKRVLLLIFVLFLAACSSSTEPEEPPPTSMEDVQADVIPTSDSPEAAPTERTGNPTVESSSSSTAYSTYPPTMLTPDGPWLVYFDDMGARFIAMNRDGSGWTQLDIPLPTTEWGKLYGMEQQVFEVSSQGLIAYITGDNSDVSPKPDPWLEMIIVELPSGEVYDRIPLIEPAWNEKALPVGVTDRDEFLEEVLTSITMAGSFTWSPDGRYLGYIGATHGPSADVYVYDTQVNAARVMTSGAGQVAALDFSPNGSRLYHLALREFGEDPFWDVLGSWSIDPPAVELEPILEENRMLFVDRWLGEDSFIGHDWGIVNGPENLWTVEVKEGDAMRFYTGPLGLHVYDTAGSTVALELQDWGESADGLEPGLYVQPRYGGTPIEVVSDIQPLSIEYSENLDRFVAGLADRTVLFKRNGELDLIIPRGGDARMTSGGGMILISSDGELAPPGAWVYTNRGQLFQTLSEDPVRYAQWDPYSDGVFLLREFGEIIYWPWLFDATYLVGQVDTPFFSGLTTVAK